MAKNQTTCSNCGIQFTFEEGRGKARTLCSKDCRAASAKARANARRAGFPSCSHDGCERVSRSAGAGYCEMHYYRFRRNGTSKLKIELSPPQPVTVHPQGYLKEYNPDHWISGQAGDNRIYQHRRVYFDAHGEGPFRCHWCGASVSWDNMHVDHVNASPDDNRLDNLVASCPACNVKRGTQKMTKTHRERSKAKITWRGETLTAGQWAERVGISRQSLRDRLSSGWSIERALTEPRGVTGPAKR